MRKILNPAVVLGGGLTGLGLARVLGRRGIDVYLVVDKRDEAIFTKYCKRAFFASGMRWDREVLKNLLKMMGRSLGRRAVVYPTSDLDALNLAELKEDLRDDYHFVVGDKEPVEILVNKNKFYRALNRHNMDYPTTIFTEDLEDTQQIGAKLTYPVFIRPSNSQLFNKTFSTEGKGFLAYSSKELVHYWQLATKQGVEVMFQEIVPGPPSNSYQLDGYYNQEHSPTVLFARQRLRIWPPGFGNSTLCVSIPLGEIASETKKVNDFIRRIGYSGLMSAEFKKDARDGKLKLLEINARAWWHFWLSADCGADIAFSSYLDAIGEETEYVQDYETGLKSIYFFPDLMASGKMLTNGNLGFTEWIRSMYGISGSNFCPREDLSPFIMSFVSSLLTLKRQLRHFRRARDFR